MPLRTTPDNEALRQACQEKIAKASITAGGLGAVAEVAIRAKESGVHLDESDAKAAQELLQRRVERAS